MRIDCFRLASAASLALACATPASTPEPIPATDACACVDAPQDGIFDAAVTPKLAHAWAFGAHGTSLMFDGEKWSQASVVHDASVDATLWAAWSGPKSVWVVGEAGTVARFDGGSWQTLPSPVGVDLADASTGNDSGKLTGVWGSADDDVWVVESNLLLDNRPFLHWNGSEWSRDKATTQGYGEVKTIWGTSKNDVWAAGSGAISTSLTLFHYDGATWSKVAAPSDLELERPALTAFATNDAWLGGGKSLWHWDGSSWSSTLDANGSATFTSFFGTPSELWVAGSTSTLRWDGATWTAKPTLVTASVTALGGAGTKDMWALGKQGAMAHWDGTTWQAFDSGTQEDLDAVVVSP